MESTARIGSSIHIKGVITANEPKHPRANRGTILVVTAGTADVPVAEEAVLTAMMLGNRVERLFDVGVAGIHRLLSNGKKLMEASVIIIAGRPLSHVAMPSTPRRVGSERTRRRNTIAASLR